MIGLAVSRWLGLRILDTLMERRQDITFGGVYWETKRKRYPGDPTPTEVAERCEHLGVDLKPIRTLVADCDLIVTALVSHIFTGDELSSTKVLNLHPAPLPEYRGCNSYSWAIQNGDSYYAVSLHHVTEGIDTGGVIAQKWLPIHSGDTAWTLYQRAQCVALDLFREKLHDIIYGYTYYALEQDERRARYYRRDEIPAATTLKGNRAWTFA